VLLKGVAYALHCAWGFEAETVVHKQKVDSVTENSSTVITEDPEIGTYSLKNNGRYAFTGSEMDQLQTVAASTLQKLTEPMPSVA